MYSIVLMVAMSGSAEVPECHKNRCCGCSGSYASCGGGRHGHGGCRGGCYGGCYGGYGGCYGGSYGCSGGYYGTPGQTMPPPAQKMPPAPPPQKTDESAPASIHVTLPADAVLTVDGAATTSASGSRWLVTPALQPGVAHQYTLRAQIVRDGQTLAQTRTVQVQAGRDSEVRFDFAETNVSAER